MIDWLGSWWAPWVLSSLIVGAGLGVYYSLQTAQTTARYPTRRLLTPAERRQWILAGLLAGTLLALNNPDKDDFYRTVERMATAGDSGPTTGAELAGAAMASGIIKGWLAAHTTRVNCLLFSVFVLRGPNGTALFAGAARHVFLLTPMRPEIRSQTPRARPGG